MAEGMQASVLPPAMQRRVTHQQTCKGGGGARIGMVIGGRPGISITWEPTGAGPPGKPSGGMGGGGGMPLLVWMVMTAPGIVCPLGVVPTTSPYFALLLIDTGWSATWKPASFRR